jgi:hypothetical protein
MKLSFFSRSGHSGSVDDWFTPGRFAAILAGLIFALFPDVVLGQRTFFLRDFQTFAYPWAHFHREAFWRGDIPLWNPLSNCGIPFLAQWNTMTVYPLSLFYLVFPLSWSLGVFCLGHLFLGGLGMYFLAHRWTGHRWGASLAGLAFALNGLSLNSLMWTNNIAALGWMPWVVLSVEAAWREGRGRVLQSALVGAMQMLTGAPEIIVLTWVLLGAIGLGDGLRIGAPRWQMFRRFLAVVTLVAGLTAIQILPFLDLLAHSQRDRSFGANVWAMPVWGLANFLVPLFFSFPWTQGVFFQYDQYWTASYYVSIGVVLTALMTWRERRHRRVAVLLALLTMALVLAMGEQGYVLGWLKRAVPALGFMRYPVKLVVLAVFILPLLSAFTVRRLATSPPSQSSDSRREIVLATCVTLGLVAFILWFARFHPKYPPPFNQWPATWHSGWTRGLLLLVFATGLGTLPYLTHARAQWLLRMGLMLVLWLDLFTHAPNLSPTVDRWVYEPGEAIGRELPSARWSVSRAMTSAEAESVLHQSTAQKAADHAVRLRLGLYCNCNLIDGIPKVGGVYSLHIPQVDEVCRLLRVPHHSPPPGLVDFLAVSHATAPGKTVDWQSRTSCLPLVSSGQQPMFISDAEALQRLDDPGFDPQRIVLLPPEARTHLPETQLGKLRILSQSIHSREMTFETEADQPALLVLAQSFYHPWRAYVDAQSVPVWRANHAFQALAVPPGRHHVRLSYEDRYFTWGAVISILTLTGCVLGAGYFKFRKREGRG